MNLTIDAEELGNMKARLDNVLALNGIVLIQKDELEKQKDNAYKERDMLVCALSKLFPSTLGRHVGEPWEYDWRWIVFINLPAGQCAWHIHDSELSMFDHLIRFNDIRWDGHTAEEKYERLASLKVGY